MNSIDEIIKAKKNYTYRLVTNNPEEGIVRAEIKNQPGLPADKIFEYADMASWNTPMDGDERFHFKEESGPQYGKKGAFKINTTYVAHTGVYITNWKEELRNNNNH